MSQSLPLSPLESESLAPTRIIDSDHPSVREFAAARTAGATTPVERAVRLYYAVRDGIRYDPYQATVDESELRASATLARGHGWCVSKAVLLAAACRAVGVPARLGFADVRNHLSTARMREQMQTDVFYWHGYTSLRLTAADRWLKATPAFNIELCQKFGLLPLEFDGERDSIFHPADREGRRHMEYVRERGEYSDLPLAEIRATFRERYPYMTLGFGSEPSQPAAKADFEADVDAEVAKG